MKCQESAVSTATPTGWTTQGPDSDLPQTANGFSPCGSITTQYNTQMHKSHTQYTSHTHKITPLNTNNKTKQKQISSQSYTNSKGHITGNEHTKAEQIKRSLMHTLEAC
jgi:hypothetical protein